MKSAREAGSEAMLALMGLNPEARGEFEVEGHRFRPQRTGDAIAAGIAVPELYQKRVISLDDPELYRVVDTSA